MYLHGAAVQGLGQTDVLDTTPGTGIAPSTSAVWIGLLAILALPWLISLLNPAETTVYSRGISGRTSSRRTKRKRASSRGPESVEEALEQARKHGRELLGRS